MASKTIFYKSMIQARKKQNEILKELVENIEGTIFFNVPIKSPYSENIYYVGVSKEYIVISGEGGYEYSNIGSNSISSSILKKIVSETKKVLK